MSRSRIDILGAGGIGVALAVALVRADRDVVLVDTVTDKIGSGRREGIEVAGFPPVRCSVCAFESWQPAAATPVLLCTKTFDNAAVLAKLPAVTPLVPVQNGYDPALEARDHAGEGIASFVSECERARPRTRITRPGVLHLGPRRDVNAAEAQGLRELAAAIGRGGLFPVEFVTDVRPYKATKLMYNAAISPLAASAGVDNGELLTDELAKTLFFAILRENYSILKQAGTTLARIGPFHPDTVQRILTTPWLPHLMAMFFRPSLRGTYCSMAPDIGTGMTEIDAYNGHLVRLAGDYPCPLNRAAYELVSRLDRERLSPHRNHLAVIAKALPKAAGR
jgi:2-dehydropantoate 2-reductase